MSETTAPLGPGVVPEGSAPQATGARAPAVTAVPKWVRVVTVSAVSVVAAVAAVVSYVHMRQLGINAGEAWRADIIPLSADGLLVAASMVMYVRRRAGEKAGILAWVGLVLGLLASLGANLAVADWTSPVSIAVSGWPPLALAIAFELLIGVQRNRQLEVVAQRQVITPPVVAAPAQDDSAATERPHTPRPPSKPRRRQAAKAPAIEDLVEDARPLVAKGVGRPTLAKELGIKDNQARQLMDVIRAEQPAEHTTNGKAVLS